MSTAVKVDCIRAPEKKALFSRRVYGVLGIPIDAVEEQDVLRFVQDARVNRAPFLLSTPNLNYLVTSLANREFRESLLVSDLCPADGMPIVWLAKMLGVPVKKRCSGASVFEAIKRGPGHGPVKVFLFGGADGLADKVLDLINKSSRGMKCVGAISPGYGSIDDLSRSEFIDQINKSGADFLAVFLSAAKGQAWLLKNHWRLTVPVRVHLGATINFQAAVIRRAPPILQTIGMEWLWRIKEEPHLWRRYWHDGKQLVSILALRVLPMVFEAAGRKVVSREQALSATAAQTAGHTVLTFKGAATDRYIDSAIVALEKAAMEDSDISLDLSGVSDIDTRFFGLLLLFRKELLDQNRQMDLVGVQGWLLRAFQRNGFEFLLATQNGSSDMRSSQ